VLRILLRAIRTALRHGSPGAGPDAQIGAISYLVVLDGVFTETDGGVRFQETTHFSPDAPEPSPPYSSAAPGDPGGSLGDLIRMVAESGPMPADAQSLASRPRAQHSLDV
jgi:hypothetical protein